MSTEPFTDELLSAIIDGEADAETVASVEADPVASARLAQMRQAVELVAAPVPEASPERRSASIAAAMAAATPMAPEVTSLAAARHERAANVPQRAESRGQWLILAAAAVALIVAIPLVLQFRGGSDAAETAADTTSSDDTSFSVDDSASDDAAEAPEDVADSAEEVVEAEAAMDEDAMEESTDADDAMDDAAMADDAMDADDSASDDSGDDEDVETPDAADRFASAPSVSNLEILDEFISFGQIAPILTADEAIDASVSPACIDSLIAEIEQTTGQPFVDEAIFDIAFLGDAAENQRLVIIAFLEDGTTIALDAEDCARLG